MSKPQLRLAREREAQPDTYFLERRRSPRRRVAGMVTALLTERDGEGDQTGRICSLQLQDLSDTGLAAVSHERLPEGTTITVFFPPHGPERGFDLHGTIVRSEAREHGCAIGIDLRQRAAA